MPTLPSNVIDRPKHRWNRLFSGLQNRTKVRTNGPSSDGQLSCLFLLLKKYNRITGVRSKDVRPYYYGSGNHYGTVLRFETTGPPVVLTKKRTGETIFKTDFTPGISLLLFPIPYYCRSTEIRNVMTKIRIL